MTSRSRPHQGKAKPISPKQEKLPSGNQTSVNNDVTSQATIPSQLSTSGKSGYDADDELSSRSQISRNGVGVSVGQKKTTTVSDATNEHQSIKRKHHINHHPRNDSNQSSSDDSGSHPAV
ncbi:hypothetical protein Ocin01_01650 [Orchesella cincta]|uniref:Uncharacterized protein n=1 Tax=Orchesella cincta TaxID=48709 RepID=A0A1D2NIU3_ORCCI|nr:hypothetical protein Ocin01_01650 [Orchesella cincta]